MTHSKGPFTFEKVKFSLPECYAIKSSDGSTFGIVQNESDGFRNNAHTEGNARLFAASWDLLKALKSAVEAMKKLECSDNYYVICDEVEQGIEAIKKATGEA